MRIIWRERGLPLSCRVFSSPLPSRLYAGGLYRPAPPVFALQHGSLSAADRIYCRRVTCMMRFAAWYTPPPFPFLGYRSRQRCWCIGFFGMENIKFQFWRGFYGKSDGLEWGRLFELWGLQSLRGWQFQSRAKLYIIQCFSTEKNEKFFLNFFVI